jgi:hypothetical protein
MKGFQRVPTFFGGQITGMALIGLMLHSDMKSTDQAIEVMIVWLIVQGIVFVYAGLIEDWLGG